MPDSSGYYATMREETPSVKCSTKIVVCLLFVCILAAVAAAATLLAIAATSPHADQWKNCTDNCSIVLTESIPVNLTFPSGSPEHVSTFEAWMNLIDLATESIDIASYYWTLRGEDVYVDPSDRQGEQVYSALKTAGTKRGIAIRIVQNQPSKYNPDEDTRDLQTAGAAQVRSMDFEKLIGAGILHTKMWIVDGKHTFIGSANMDWRSLTQVKELSVVFYNCTCVAQDAAKIFEVYWQLGKADAKIPTNWPANYSTPYNAKTPLQLKANGTELNVYLSSSPPEFCPEGRTNDIDAILNVMDNAKSFIHIAVMEYYPFLAYSNPRRFWPVIDDKLRSMAYDHNVSVRLMASRWNHSDPDMFAFLSSLAALNNVGRMHIEVKIFVVPASAEQAKIPFSRVNHNKYMVTDQQAYIGTSNWSEDYFLEDGGVGIIINQASASKVFFFRQQLAEAFERDWSSPFAHSVPPKIASTKPHRSTSNWSKDYFVTTGGIGVIVNQTSEAPEPMRDQPVAFRQQLANVFERDWNSKYAVPI